MPTEEFRGLELKLTGNGVLDIGQGIAAGLIQRVGGHNRHGNRDILFALLTVAGGHDHVFRRGRVSLVVQCGDLRRVRRRLLGKDRKWHGDGGGGEKRTKQSSH